MEKNTTSFAGKERALGTMLHRFGSFLVPPQMGYTLNHSTHGFAIQASAISLVLHLLTSAFYVIITHTCNYNSLGQGILGSFSSISLDQMNRFVQNDLGSEMRF